MMCGANFLLTRFQERSSVRMKTTFGRFTAAAAGTIGAAAPASIEGPVTASTVAISDPDTRCQLTWCSRSPDTFAVIEQRVGKGSSREVQKLAVIQRNFRSV